MSTRTHDGGDRRERERRAVLLVEDSEHDAYLITRSIRKMRPDLLVERVCGEDEALQALAEGDYIAALLDHHLGSCTGLDIIRKCRTAGLDLPLILLSGYADRSVDVQAMEDGASDYLNKGELTPELLERSIRYACDRVRASRAIMASQRRFEAAVSGSNDGIWELDLQSGDLFLSERFKEMLGFGEHETPNTKECWFSKIAEPDRQSVRDAIEDHLAGRTKTLCIEHRVVHPDGTQMWVLLRGKVHQDAYGEHSTLAGSQSDITAAKRAEERARYLALHDVLTGLPNRAFMSDRLGEAAARLRGGLAEGFSLLYIDLDDFKAVNDKYGHGAGDKVLVTTGVRLRAAIGEEGVVARLGGDEFVVLVDGCTCEKSAERIATRMRSAIIAPIDVGETSVSIDASIGAHVVLDPDIDSSDYFDKADAAMYGQKLARKAVSWPRASRWSGPPFEGMVRRLQDALKSGDVLPHYQPIVDCRTAEVVGYEALARWNDGRAGPVSPARFVPVAEANGLVSALTFSMLRQGCAWVAALDGQSKISVNVSAEDLESPAFARFVEWSLDESGLDGTRLELELTERVELADRGAACRVMAQLAERGVTLTLDDFGTGFSSLDLMLALPVSGIKLDAQLVREVERDHRRTAVIARIVQMAHDLRLRVTAEGIENQAQWSAVRTLNVERLQGFLFGRPSAQPELVQELRSAS